MGWVIELRNGSNSEVPIEFAEEKATSSMRNWLAFDGSRAVVDPMHVETSFVRNLGGLIRARTGMPGRFMKARAER
jgi:hypothetical protein